MAVVFAATGCSEPPVPPLGILPGVGPATDDSDLLFSCPADDSLPAGRLTAEPWSADSPRAWRYIVIHHSATADGNAERFDLMHRNRGWDELGYHFVITNGRGGMDGQVQVGSRWKTQKWGAHAGGTPNNEYNEYGIGICLVGDFMDQLPTVAQRASLERLVLYLMNRYNIPPENVMGHRDVPNASTQCPGNALHRYIHGPLARVLVSLQ